MADWFDDTVPADSDLEGNGNIHIKAIKTELNTLDGVVGQFATGDADDSCVAGWPRVFYAATFAALAALSPGVWKAGRLGYTEDTNTLWIDTGSAWERIVPGPLDIRIPLLVAFGHPAEELPAHGKHDRFDNTKVHYGKWGNLKLG